MVTGGREALKAKTPPTMGLLCAREKAEEKRSCLKRRLLPEPCDEDLAWEVSSEWNAAGWVGHTAVLSLLASQFFGLGFAQLCQS